MNELEKLQVGPHVSCLGGEEEGGMGGSWRGRQEIAHVGLCRPCVREFVFIPTDTEGF